MKKISVIIVNYNGKKYLEECIKSIIENNYKNLEIIVVDNNSSDGSQDLIKDKFNQVILIEETSNHGFAGGNNIGYKVSTGDIIVLLNNDTKIEKDFFVNMLPVFEEHPKCGVAQAKVVLYDTPEVLDSAGSFWHYSTFLYHYGYLKDSNKEEFNKPYKTFTVKGAAMFIKREIIEKVGLFDSDFWHYYEETDFCHRVINSGKEVWYYPKAICFHKIGVSRTILNQEEKIIFTNIRNKIFSIYKNFYLLDLISVLSRAYLTFFCLIVIFLYRKDLYNAKIYSKVIIWSILNIKKLITKRYENKFKGSEKILPSKNISILYFFYPHKY